MEMTAEKTAYFQYHIEKLLASEMGKGQADSVFVFDEPTIGLHPLDVQTCLLYTSCRQGGGERPASCAGK